MERIRCFVFIVFFCLFFALSSAQAQRQLNFKKTSQGCVLNGTNLEAIGAPFIEMKTLDAKYQARVYFAKIVLLDGGKAKDPADELLLSKYIKMSPDIRRIVVGGNTGAVTLVLFQLRGDYGGPSILVFDEDVRFLIRPADNPNATIGQGSLPFDEKGLVLDVKVRVGKPNPPLAFTVLQIVGVRDSQGFHAFEFALVEDYDPRTGITFYRAPVSLLK